MRGRDLADAVLWLALLGAGVYLYRRGKAGTAVAPSPATAPANDPNAIRFGMAGNSPL
jgi:hypothetical protein